MSDRSSGRRRSVVLAALTVAFAAAALPAPASAAAETTVFCEQTTEAFWVVPHTCADGTVVQATLLVSGTLDYESPDTEDAEPTARVQYLAVCPDGRSFSKSVSVTGSGLARDNLGGSHVVTFT
jgi:hypothetical protein